MPRAISSLPVPLSPSSSTGAVDLAARSRIANTWRIVTAPPYSAPNRSAFDGGMSTTSSAGISWISVLPIRSATPGGATTFRIATPSITVPFLEPRSVITNPCGLGATEQWRRDTNESVSAMSHARSVPITAPICGRSSSTPRSGPSTTRSCAAPTCPRDTVAFVTRVTSTSGGSRAETAGRGGGRPRGAACR